MSVYENPTQAGKNVRLINLTDKVVNNIMWLDLLPNTSIGLSWNDYLMLQADEGVKDMIDNKVLEVEFCD